MEVELERIDSNDDHQQSDIDEEALNDDHDDNQHQVLEVGGDFMSNARFQLNQMHTLCFGTRQRCAITSGIALTVIGILIAVAILIVGVSVMFSYSSSSSEESTSTSQIPINHPSTSNIPIVIDKFDDTHRNDKIYRPTRGEMQKHLQSIRVFRNALAAAVAGSSIDASSQSIDQLYFQSCWNDNDWFRMFSDPMCVMLWLKKVQHQEIVRTDEVLGVITDEEIAAGMNGEKPTQNGGMRMHLADGTKAYWKPCYGEAATAESYKGEVLAAIFDKMAGFYRTCAVAAVHISNEKLRQLATDMKNRAENLEYELAEWNVETIIKHCGDKDGRGVTGAMVGWSPFPVERLHTVAGKRGRLVDFRKINQTEVNTLRHTTFAIDANSSYEELRVTLENIAVYMVNLLQGYPAKLDHNVYLMHPRSQLQSNIDGPDVYIDNDRTSWRDHTTMEKWKISRNDPICQICRFPKSIVDRLLVLNGGMQEEMTLGSLMNDVSNSLYPHLTEGPLMSTSNATILDLNMVWMIDCIDRCVAKYGASKVIIPEPWIRDYEFFSYFEQLQLSSSER